MFLIRMSDDGVGAEAYHEEMRKHSRLIYRLIYCCLYRALVVIDEMVDAG